MKVTKKLLSLALAAAIVVTGFSLPAFAESREVINPSDLSGWYVYDHYGSNVKAEDFKDSQKPYQSAPSGGGTQISSYAAMLADIENKDYNWGGPVSSCDDPDQHIWVDGNSNSANVIFVGYTRGTLSDFILYPSTSDARKIVSFDLDGNYVFPHSMDGFGIFFNTKVTKAAGENESDKMTGYCAYYLITSPDNKPYQETMGDIYLIEFKDVDMKTLANSIGFTEQKDSLTGKQYIASSKKFGSFDFSGSNNGKLHIEMEINSNNMKLTQTPYERITVEGSPVEQLKLSDQKVYTESVTPTGASGFGMLADYNSARHGCLAQSSIIFSDFRMMSNYTVRYIRGWDKDKTASPPETFVYGSTPNIEPGSEYTVELPTHEQIVNGIPKAEDDNWEFVNWAYDTDTQTGVVIKPGDKIEVNSAIDIYAVWKKKAAGLNFSPDGGKWPDGFNDKGDTANWNVQKEMGDTIDAADKPAKNPTKDWHVADGWQYENGTEVKFDGTQKLTEPSITVKPIWKEDFNGDGIPDDGQTKWSVSFEDGDHGRVTGDTTEFTVIDGAGSETLGDAIELKKDNAKLPGEKADEGYAFAGWDVNGNIYTGDLEDLSISGNTTIKPNYVPAYTIEFKPGPGGSLKGDTTVTVVDGKPIGKVPDVEADDGYEFKEWEDGDGNLYTPEQLKDHVPNGDESFTAKFEQGDNFEDGVVYNITFQYPGGPMDREVTAGDEITSTPSSSSTPPLKLSSKQKLSGWTDQHGNFYTDAEVQKIKPEENMVFTAKIETKRR